MIIVTFNDKGYQVLGDNTEIVRSCSPSLTERGDPIFQVIHHTYKILYLALNEIRDMKTNDDVTVYGDSRIIDEMNGVVSPLDSVCDQWTKLMRRVTLPSIKGVVMFRKKAASEVAITIQQSHERALKNVDRNVLAELAKKEINYRKQMSVQRKRSLVSKLRENWFGK